MVFLVKFSEIHLRCICRVVIDHNGIVRTIVNIDHCASLIRIAVKIHRRAFNTVISPVVAKRRIGNYGLTVRHLGICLSISFENIEILVKRLYLRVTRPLKNTDLDPESSTVVNGFSVHSIVVIENVCPVNMSVVLAEHIPFGIGIKFLKIRIDLKIRIPCYKKIILI